MDTTFRQIVRHAGVFGIGAILSRLASVVLLPVYTHYLQPADYGVIAVIDLTVSLLGIAGGAGIAAAATREHFQRAEERHHDRVWWTALAMVGALTAAVFGPALLLKERLADVAFGGELRDGAYYLAIAVPTAWIGVVTYVIESYFRVRKASVFLVSVGLGRLLLNIALNVALLAWLHLGVAAILLGNLAAAAITCTIQMVVFVRTRGPAAFDQEITRQYWRFGWPIMLFGLLSSLMHEADRYILLRHADLEQVGIYSMAYQIGQGVNTLIITPFFTIWGVLLYEVAHRPDREEVYARVFKNYAMGLALLLLLASMFAGPILTLLAPPEYAPAAKLVPIVCLAYWFFSLHDHFKVPALIASRTTTLLPIVALAAAANIGVNLVLIPSFGGFGAAWASVITFVLFSGVGLLQYRRIARYPYPFVACALVMAGMIATFALQTIVAARIQNGITLAVFTAVIWLGWAVALFGKTAVELLSMYGPRLRKGRAEVPMSTPSVSSIKERSAVAGLEEP